MQPQVQAAPGSSHMPGAQSSSSSTADLAGQRRLPRQPAQPPPAHVLAQHAAVVPPAEEAPQVVPPAEEPPQMVPPAQAAEAPAVEPPADEAPAVEPPTDAEEPPAQEGTPVFLVDVDDETDMWIGRHTDVNLYVVCFLF